MLYRCVAEERCKPKLFFEKKQTFDSSPPLSKILFARLVVFTASNRFFKRLWAADTTSPENLPYLDDFFDMNTKFFKLRIICNRTISVSMCKSSVCFSAVSLSASIPPLRSLRRRYCSKSTSKSSLLIINPKRNAHQYEFKYQQQTMHCSIS